MIVPMRMVTLICRQPEVAGALVELRELGVLHLLPHRLRPSSELDRAQKQRDWFAAALAPLPAALIAGNPIAANPIATNPTASADAAAVATEVPSGASSSSGTPSCATSARRRSRSATSIPTRRARSASTASRSTSTS